MMSDSGHGRDTLYWIFKGLLKPLLLATYDLRVEGLDNVPRKGPAIIAANHLSFLDSFFIPLMIKRRKVTYLAKADYFNSWKTAWFFRMVGQIPIERDDKSQAREALDAGVEVLKAGKLLGIYPEGTRSPDGKLYRGRTGVARIALAAGVPVVPCGLSGTEEIMPKNAKRPHLRHVTIVVRFGEPLEFSAHAGKERDRNVLRGVTDEVMNAIVQLSGQERADEYASSGKTTALPGGPGDEGDEDLSQELTG
ncbi:MAG: 1-acyl-sn-glycerol-3-phosphate acyltransferase [Actinomycetota bacterium]|jgi:1-acyl-sn-glycerol-3-phosphate acyltransferase|nr:1-acyl-sn-glycerol-3-phosphate acyltransferase [Actinomycetota bacterium]